jgi:hypothetical protein
LGSFFAGQQFSMGCVIGHWKDSTFISVAFFLSPIVGDRNGWGTFRQRSTIKIR